MSKQTFFDFTIQGDNLDIHALKDETGLPSSVFTKGQEIFAESINRNVISRSTRWVYSSNELCKRPDIFLKKQLEIISKNLSVLKNYIEKFDSSIQITIYAGNKTDITLNAKHLELLNKIGASFSISFC